jgi:hypothetical protein
MAGKKKPSDKELNPFPGITGEGVEATSEESKGKI